MKLTYNKITGPTLQKQLRLWPGMIIVFLQWFVRFGLPIIIPGDTTTQIGVFGGILGGLAVAVWWAFFSRAIWYDRLGALVLMIVAFFATANIIHVSIATSMMGMMFMVYSIPVLSLAFVAGLAVSRNLSDRRWRTTMIAIILVASGFWALLRTDGMSGAARQYFAWRWSKTAEERLLAETDNWLSEKLPDSAAIESGADWTGFRGLNRDGIIHGVRIATDWSKSPPIEMWRRSVGPGCSSFAVHGALLYTQEQRGEYEMVTCYNLNTGEPVWRHSDTARFWDSHAGAGPRSTPTFSNGRIYTLGATGVLNVLNALDGTVVWSRHAAKETGEKMPGWGYTSSPLVIDSVVVVAIAGKLLAYNIITGNQLWSCPDGGESYSSPHLLTIDGVRQIIFTNKAGAAGYLPADGKVLWNFPLTGNNIIQPALINDRDILIDIGNIKGMKLIAIKNGSGRWTAEEKWTSNKFKPNFSDFVIHKGYVFGFEGPVLECIDIENGERRWRGGRYGGQLILLEDQDMLLVLSEEGEVALVKATPEQFKELARFPAIKGRTWNHPVLVGDVLVVRNSLEMAAFRLSLKGT
jgi:outer membrane protein assembly factor BamB